jgi:hypothetical protein
MLISNDLLMSKVASPRCAHRGTSPDTPPLTSSLTSSSGVKMLLHYVLAVRKGKVGENDIFLAKYDD